MNETAGGRGRGLSKSRCFSQLEDRDRVSGNPAPSLQLTEADMVAPTMCLSGAGKACPVTLPLRSLCCPLPR